MGIVEVTRSAVFLDRDGVLNDVIVRDGTPRPPSNREEFRWLDGAQEACAALSASGFPLVVITNQPDIARGVLSAANVDAVNAIIREGVPVLDVLTCPHDGPDGCPCRKPKPGLLLKAARDWDLDLAKSYMVGDRWSDVEAGRTAGCATFLIEKPYSRGELCRPDWVVADLKIAASIILKSGAPHE